MRKCVLIVAQDLALRARIARALQSAGYAVELAASSKRALKLAADRKIGAAVVVPGSGATGTAMVRELHTTVPRIIVLVDSTDEVVRPSRSLLAAYALPLQPLDEQELLARLAEVMASPASAGDETAPAILGFEGCRLDLAGRIFVDTAGQEVSLTRAESALMTIFVRNPRRVLSRDQLRRAVAGHSTEPYDRAVDVLVGRLRRKIEPDQKTPRFILTVSGAGYKFTARPQSDEGAGNPPPAIELEGRTEVQPTLPDRFGPRERVPASAVGGGIALPRSQPERRQLTVLSCGLAGVTALAINFDPEDMGGVIRRFQNACTVAITRMGGSIARSMDDETLALFGYPQAHEDDAERAVQAGLDLVASVGLLLSPSGEALQAQAGIATGLVLVGGEQGIIGDPPTVAVRLRIMAPSNSVVVTARTRKLLGGGFVCAEPELYELAGVSEPVTACRVAGTRTVRS